jgi:hypothetical protein
VAEQWQAEHDRRQYDLMEEHLRHFEEGVTDLGALIAGLDTLLECLEAADKAWKAQFRSEWWTLEQVYALALDRGQTQLPPESRALINEAVKNMRRLLADRITAETAASES